MCVPRAPTGRWQEGGSQLLRGFRSPHRKRMTELADEFPLRIPNDKVLMGHVQRIAETDLALREFLTRVPSFVLSRMEGGSGFRMANLLRNLFLEYFGRLASHGPHSLPSSFNVTEAFFAYSKKYIAFDLREEREHLLRLHEYFNWFTEETSALPEDPRALEDVMPDGIIYSYDTIGPVDDFCL